MKEPFKTLEIEGVEIRLYQWYTGSRYVDCHIVNAPDNVETRTMILVKLDQNCKNMGLIKKGHVWKYELEETIHA